MATLNGIDISSWQSGISIAKMTTTDFVIVKATGGTSYTNEYLTNHANATLAAGKLLGLYHYAREKSCKGSAEAEAQHFVDAAKPYIGKAIFVLDWEEELSSGEAWALSWLNQVKKLTGVTPIFYCYQSALEKYKYSKIAAAGYKLWLAQYANMSAQYGYKTTPWQSGSIGAFSSYIMHQYSSKGRITGYGSDLDLNQFKGGTSNWKALASKSTETSTGDDTVSYYIANACNGDTGITGGQSGDQSGNECKIQAWYSYPWNTVLRAYSEDTAEDIAMAMQLGCNNNNIGYDQSNRTSLYTAMAKLGWNAANMAKVGSCETDCSAMVAVAVNCAGITVSKDIYTGNEATTLLATGKFYKVTGAALTDPAYLRRGDILINTSSHTAVAMDNGSKAAARLTKSSTTSTTTTATASAANYNPSVASGMQKWLNSSGAECTVYSSTKESKRVEIGTLGKNDSAYCFGKVWSPDTQRWWWLVAYTLDSYPAEYKVGYVDDGGSCTF